MSVLSAQTIRRLGLVRPCVEPYKDTRGNSAGLSACGYDLTLDQDVAVGVVGQRDNFVLASAAEELALPVNVVGIVHDKSSLARCGLAVQNTVAEPGWSGFLTLELSNHGEREIFLPAGSAVAQVIFHFLDEDTTLPYVGKYQNQTRGPQEAK